MMCEIFILIWIQKIHPRSELSNLWYFGFIFMHDFGMYVKDLSFIPTLNPVIELSFRYKLIIDWFCFGNNAWDNDFFFAWYFCLITCVRLSILLSQNCFFPLDTDFYIPWEKFIVEEKCFFWWVYLCLDLEFSGMMFVGTYLLLKCFLPLGDLSITTSW